jgi:hypothetical protein
MNRPWRYLWIGALLTACDNAQAPPEVVPPPPAFTTIVVDSQFGADYDHAIRYPTIAVSEGTTLNLLYGLFENGQLRYAGCPIACDERRYWRVGTSDSGSAGDFVGAAVANQQIHVAFQAWRPAGFPAYLKYGTCPGLCDQSSNWTGTEVDTLGNTGWLVSMTADPAAVHIAYLRYANPMQLRYATCAASCGSASSWSLTTIDTAQGFGETQIVHDATAGLHIVYEVLDIHGTNPPSLRYTTCSAACTSAANWHTVPIGTGRLPSLTMTSDGRLSLAYVDGPGTIRAAICAVACVTGGWSSAPLVASSSVTDVALAIAPDGGWHLAYADDGIVESRDRVVRYATCASSCSDSLNWRSMTIDSTEFAPTYFVALAIDSTNRVTLAHATSGVLRATTIKRAPE